MDKTRLRARRRVAPKLICALLMLSSGSALAQSPYRLTILGPMDPAGFVPQDINDAGQIAGSVSTVSVSGGETSVALWDGVSLKFLGLGGPSAINNAGQMAGVTNGTGQVMVWNSVGAATSFGTGQAWDINDLGQVVGYRWVGGGPHATLWHGGSATDLGPGRATGINNAGQVVGGALDPPGASELAALWDNHGLTLLGGINSFANAINDRGQIVGSDRGQAHVWDGTRSVDLANNEGWSITNARDINNVGQVVGYWMPQSPLYRTYAALWDGGAGTDLNSLLRPDSAAVWVLADATAINEAGTIIGTAYDRGNCLPFAHSCGTPYGFVLSISDLPDQVLDITTAVPEPSTYALMLAGLGAIGVWAQRRRAASAS